MSTHKHTHNRARSYMKDMEAMGDSVRLRPYFMCKKSVVRCKLVVEVVILWTLSRVRTLRHEKH